MEINATGVFLSIFTGDWELQPGCPVTPLRFVIRTPCAWTASLSIFGWRMCTDAFAFANAQSKRKTVPANRKGTRVGAFSAGWDGRI